MALIRSFSEIVAGLPPLEPPPPLEIDLAGEVGDFGILGALGDFVVDLTNSINTVVATNTTNLETYGNTVGESIVVGLRDFATQADATFAQIVDKIDGLFGGVEARLGVTIGGLEGQILGSLSDTATQFTNVVGAIDTRIQEDIEGSTTSVLDTLASVAGTVLDKIGGAIDAVEGVIDPITDKVGGAIAREIDRLEGVVSKPLAVLAESLPLQVASLGNILQESLAILPDLPSSISDAIGGIFTTLASTLGLDQLLEFFGLVGQVTTLFKDRIAGSPNLETVPGSWDVPRSTVDQINVALSAIPIFGSFIEKDHPAEFERLRQNSFEHTRPTQLDVGSTLEFIRRFPDEADSVLNSLERGGLAQDKIDSLLRIRHTPLQMLDNLDGWRRGEIDEPALDTKLRANGLSPEDGELAKRLSRRIPPIQDLILFAVRGVFDVEESRRFGEFEGLPPQLEQQFIRTFDIEGGDFSRQVEVFSDAAQKLGLPEEWVAAYWTAHWRLPSLQNAYQMFHRLAPDIVDAEADDFRADGFDPEKLKFDRPSLDRLVRAADFSGFWRDKLSAIAFNPLTRVDIRRMHKLGILDNEATHRAYRKVGFSPSDADKMLAFTVAFNDEPDAAQTDEIRALTKAQVLDFVEAELFTPEEGVESLRAIGYDEFAAVGFVDLELAKRDRSLQRTAINLVEERVLAGLIDLNEATLQLDTLGTPPAQKAGVLRTLEVKLAKRTRQPTRGELDAFFGGQIITEDQYRTGLLSLGYPEDWADRFIQLNKE